MKTSKSHSEIIWPLLWPSSALMYCSKYNYNHHLLKSSALDGALLLHQPMHNGTKFFLKPHSKYHKVASFNTSRLDAHAGFCRLLMKRIFDPYVLWPFDKKLISYIVTHVKTSDYQVALQQIISLWYVWRQIYVLIFK